MSRAVSRRRVLAALLLLPPAVAGCALTLHPFSGGRSVANDASPRGALRNPAFLAIAGAAGLIQASHAIYYGFSTLDWQRAGFDGTTIGALWALGVLAEIALFAVSGRLPAAVTPKALIVAGAVGAFIRWSAMALDPPAAMLPALQILRPPFLRGELLWQHPNRDFPELGPKPCWFVTCPMAS